jgi:tRNA(adenine34) deaminase
MTSDEIFMAQALEEARKSGELNEVPVGAVLVYEGKVLSRRGNRTRSKNCIVHHAEIEVIEEASRVLDNERLTGTELYVTKEPCAMCAGAIVNARISRVIIGARDTRYGACGTVLHICGNELLNHRPEITWDVYHEESSRILKDFFRKKR